MRVVTVYPSVTYFRHGSTGVLFTIEKPEWIVHDTYVDMNMVKSQYDLNYMTESSVSTANKWLELRSAAIMEFMLTDGTPLTIRNNISENLMYFEHSKFTFFLTQQDRCILLKHLTAAKFPLTPSILPLRHSEIN